MYRIIYSNYPYTDLKMMPKEMETKEEAGTYLKEVRDSMVQSVIYKDFTEIENENFSATDVHTGLNRIWRIEKYPK